MNGGHPTCAHGQAQQVAVVKKYAEALELRTLGLTYQEIADKLGYADPSGAHHAVERALKQTLQEPSNALRAVEMHRLDKLQSMMWAKLASDDSLQATDRILRIMARRAKLTGLDYTDAEFIPIQEMQTFLLALRDIVRRYVPEDKHGALWAEMRSVRPKAGKG